MAAAPQSNRRRREVKEYDEEVIQVDRVTRVVKGGRRLRFRATVVIGDRKGNVGLGIGKATEVQTAIQKAVAKAQKGMLQVPIYSGTIPHTVQTKFKASKVLLKPAGEGTGIIAGGAVRKIMDLAGVHNVLSKSLGSDNRVNNAKATIEALKMLRERPELESDADKRKRADAEEDRAAPEVKKMKTSEAKEMASLSKRKTPAKGKGNKETAKKQPKPIQS